MFAFTFWPKIEFRHGKHMYEIRTYTLQPGTMIEWGNNWARAIQFRNKKNEAFAGFFSQVGRLSIVHHIWCFKVKLQKYAGQIFEKSFLEHPVYFLKSENSNWIKSMILGLQPCSKLSQCNSWA